MNKAIFFCFYVTVLCFSNTSGQVKRSRFVLNGNIKGMQDGYIYIHYRTIKGDGITDSALVKNGVFQLKGNISEPTRASIDTKSTSSIKNNYALIYIEPAVMTIKLVYGRFYELILTGSKSQQELEVFRKMQKPVSLPYNKLMAEHDRWNRKFIQQKRSGQMDSLGIFESQMDSLNVEMEEYDSLSLVISKRFYSLYPSSFITIYDLKNNVSEFSYSELVKYYEKLPANAKNSLAGEDLKQVIDNLVKVIPGKKAPLFSATELSGDTLKLTDYRGKYVLLDFWATWCRPCRANNPELIRLYHKYKNSRIEFIGIASDDSRVEEWREAIKKDGTGIWKHILSGHTMEKNPNDINVLYYAPIIPVIFLIDPDGIVIARYEGDEIEQNLAMRLETIFKN